MLLRKITKTWKNARGEGCLFSVELIDRDDGEIQGTFFNEACDDFYELIQEDKVYIFQGGCVKKLWQSTRI